MRSRVHLTNVCCLDFDLDPTVPPLAKSLYRILKGHVRKNDDMTTSKFVRPSLKRLRNIMRIGSDKIQHNLRVLQLAGLIIVHHGKRVGAKNEVNEYEVIDDLLLYEPNGNTLLGAEKDLFSEDIVMELFNANDFPEKPKAPPKAEVSEEAKQAAHEICLRLESRKVPNLIISENSWAAMLDSLKSDKMSIGTLKELALYGITDDFWGAHVTNPKKFKRHLSTLYIQQSKKKKFGVDINQKRSELG